MKAKPNTCNIYMWEDMEYISENASGGCITNVLHVPVQCAYT